MNARGTFDVKLVPIAPAHAGEDALGRMSIDKQFHGDLEGTSEGEMLAVLSAVKGSGGYVALERVSGSLRGSTGTFALQHSGTMDHGAQRLSVSVVPDSGTGQLVGLTGSMRIIIESGNHSYEFDYEVGGES